MPFSPRRRVLTGIALTAALAAAAVPSALADKGGDRPSTCKSSLSSTERAMAVDALERAEAVLAGTADAPLDATLALREVRMIRDTLPPSLQARAEALLARPSDEGGTWVKD